MALKDPPNVFTPYDIPEAIDVKAEQLEQGASLM
jgi:hypothetical protein